MLRKLLAVPVGYLAMAVVVMITLILGAVVQLGHVPDLTKPMPSPTVTLLLIEVIGGTLAALVGGWVAALVGRDRRSAWALAVVVLVVGLWCAIHPPAGDPSPRWMYLVMPWISAVGCVLGARCWKAPTI